MLRQKIVAGEIAKEEIAVKKLYSVNENLYQKQEDTEMAMDYGRCAKEIFETLGGRENLVSAAHCATRLRLVTVDNSRIDMKKLEDIDRKSVV